jgi:UDP-glucose:(heptosyl)LPS alpha-1,3-glucosyltransferase
MKIALVILRADPALGGAERYTVDLAGVLTRRGHQVALLSSDFANPISGVEFVPLQTAGASRLAKYVDFLQSLQTHLSENSYDIVHAMLPVRECDLYHPHAGLAAESIRSGHEKHSGTFRRALSRLGTRFNAKRHRFAAIERELLSGPEAPVTLCLSEYVKSTALRHYPDLKPKLVTLFNGVDLNRFDPQTLAQSGLTLRQELGIKEKEIMALIIAQDFARKGLAQTIEALAKVPDLPLRLVVVGKENPAKYADQARRMGIERKIIFAGPTSRPEDFYAAADFFILPTSHDPCSLVVLEALAMGLPVVSTIFNGACEIMRPDQDGIILRDPRDVNSIAQAMEKMSDRQTLAPMRESCRQLRPALGAEKHVNKLEAIYGEIVVEKAARSAR